MRMILLAPVLLAACVSSGGAPAPVASGGAAPNITTIADAEAYVLRVVAQNGCTMSLDQFDARRAADGLSPSEAEFAGPGGIAKLQQAALIDGAPFNLINRGVLVEDPADRRIVTSNGAGCA